MTGALAAQTGSPAQVTVKVTNNTAGGATVADDEVTLQLYRHDQPLQALQAQAGGDGRAVFENVPTGPHTLAVARVRHQNMAFRSQAVTLDSGGGPFSASVQVFDVSSDTSKLSVGTHHMMVGVQDAWLKITEYMQLENPSDVAVTSMERDAQNRPIVVQFTLPEGFTDLTPSSYLERSSLVVTPDGFYDTLATPPGEHQVVFSYRLPIDRGTIDITRKLSLPTSELAVFWEQGQGRLEGLGEPDSRLANAEGVPIEYYRRSDLKPGDEIAFRISGFRVETSDDYTWIVLVVAFAAVVVVALLRLRPRPSRSEAE